MTNLEPLHSLHIFARVKSRKGRSNSGVDRSARSSVDVKREFHTGARSRGCMLDPYSTQVGGRHGKPAVLIVRAGIMHGAGYEFFLSHNGVWLAGHVPAEFIDFTLCGDHAAG